MAIGFIDHQGKKVLLQDFSHLQSITEAMAAVTQARAFVDELAAGARGGPNLAMLLLTDVSESPFDSQVVDAIKELAVHHRPYVKASAVVGLTPIKRVVFRVIVMFSGRKMQPFESRGQALDWLVQQ